jgi:hypothetical protein
VSYPLKLRAAVFHLKLAYSSIYLQDGFLSIEKMGCSLFLVCVWGGGVCLTSVIHLCGSRGIFTQLGRTEPIQTKLY